MQASKAKGELVGHSTLVVMALLGMALYSATYSLLYLSTSTRVVATVEMWMTTTHLASALACCAVQGLAISLLDEPLRHVARAQTALFLGVALAVTLLAHGCISSDEQCAAYFGAAAVPKFAATGAAAWSWIMYAASLGCQTDEKISLGVLGDRAPLTAAAAMALVPHAILHKLATTCSQTWGEAAALLGVCATLLAAGLCLVWAVESSALRMLGAGLVFIEPYIAWAMASGNNKVQPIYYVVNSALGALALVYEVLIRRRKARGRLKSF